MLRLYCTFQAFKGKINATYIKDFVLKYRIIWYSIGEIATKHNFLHIVSIISVKNKRRCLYKLDFLDKSLLIANYYIIEYIYIYMQVTMTVSMKSRLINWYRVQQSVFFINDKIVHLF